MTDPVVLTDDRADRELMLERIAVALWLDLYADDIDYVTRYVNDGVLTRDEADLLTELLSRGTPLDSEETRIRASPTSSTPPTRPRRD